MSVKIRLFRRGRKKLAMYDVVIADARSPRDGKFIEKIGVYNPNTNPATIEINETKAFEWLMNGAQPTDTVKAMLSYKGLLFQKHLQIGVAKGAIKQEDADIKLSEWKNKKTSKIDSKINTLANAKAKSQKDKLVAETKVNTARTESIAIKNKPVEVVAEVAPVVVAEVAPVIVAEVASEVVAETPAAE